jgi:hypothetical protein
MSKSKTLQPDAVITDPIGGHLLVGQNTRGEVVINLPRDMTGHLVFSPHQARGLADLLTKNADELEALPSTLQSPETKVDEAWLELLGGVEEETETGPVYAFKTEHGETRLTVWRNGTCWMAELGLLDCGNSWPDDIIDRAQVLNILAALEYPIAFGGVGR